MVRHGGQRIVTASGSFGAAKEGEASIWNADTGALITRLLEGQEIVNFATFSPDGRRAVTESFRQTRTNESFFIFEARLLDMATGREIAPTLQVLHPSYSGSPFRSYSADLARVVTVQGKEARVWDLATAKPIGPPLQESHNLRHTALSRDGRRVATTSGFRAGRCEMLLPVAK